MWSRCPSFACPTCRGVPRGRRGFIPTDLYGRVEGLDDVFAAGEATTFPVKQGGIATQQADAVAKSIAALAGAPVTPEPLRPVLRGLLLTGNTPGYLQAELSKIAGHMIRGQMPVPAVRRGLRLHPDGNDPYVFRIDLAALGPGTSPVVFSCDADGKVTALHLGLMPMSFQKRPDVPNPRPWVVGALAAGATAIAIRGRR